ncbi:MAG: M23 family metallopeptidase, partial [Planctomycetota bacterium]
MRNAERLLLFGAVGVGALLVGAALAGPPKASYHLPWEAGKQQRCTQSVNGKTSHTGKLEFAIDFGMVVGTKVCAMRSGRVAKAVDEEKNNGTNGKYGASGNHVKIDHGDGTTGVYMHLVHEGALVEKGDYVLQGDVIGLSGNTGHSTGPHLHVHVVDNAGQTLPFGFAEVAAKGGVPASGTQYVSKNYAGIPENTKAELAHLAHGIRIATEENVHHLAYAYSKKLVKVKLKVPYPPQEEAAQRMEALVAEAAAVAKAATEEAQSDPKSAAEALALCAVRYKGIPKATQAFKDAEKTLAGNEAYAEARKAVRGSARQLESFCKALKSELDGKLPSARTRYKTLVRKQAGTPVGDRAAARLA